MEETIQQSLLADKFLLSRYGEFIIVLIVFPAFLYYYFKWNNRHMEEAVSKLGGPPSYPIVGSLPNYIGSQEHFIKTILDEMLTYGPEPYKIWIGPNLLNIVVTKPEDARVVLNSTKAIDKTELYDMFKNVINGSLIILSPYEKWKKRRRAVAPAFSSPEMLKTFYLIFIEKNKILIKNLEKEVGKEKSFDLWDYILPATLDMICQSALGYNLDERPESKVEFINAFFKALQINTQRLRNPFLFSDIAFSAYLRLTGQQIFFETIFKLPNQVIQEKKEKIAQQKAANKEGTTNASIEEGKNKGFLDLLLKLNDTGENFSDIQLRNEVFATIIEGSETGAVIVCNCLILLAMHQDIQDKVYDEIYNVLGDSDKTISFEDTSKLEYLEQVLKECMRLFPVLPFLHRKVNDDFKIDNLTIPKGSRCAVAVYAIHHLPELYPNPWTFNPDNFTPENIANRHQYSFLGFSGGVRGCIGYKYSMMSMKIAISNVLRNFSVHTDLKLSDIILKFDIIMRFSNGYPCTIKPRNRAHT